MTVAIRSIAHRSSGHRMSVPCADRTMIRQACPQDAPALCALFNEAYQPDRGGEAREYYPFPQLFDPDWVSATVERPEICWLVAEHAKQVVGTVGAVRNIGSTQDCVAEGFGLVVRSTVRHRGIGSCLMKTLYKRVADEARFFIAETRTANAGGWKCVQKSHFIPTGLEPFAHVTPAGREAMLMAARITPAAMRQRARKLWIRAKARSLAEAVLSPDGVLLPVVSHARGYLTHVSGWKELQRHLRPFAEARVSSQEAVAAIDGGLQVIRDDSAGKQFLRSWDRTGPHSCGVVCLKHLEGDHGNPNRYDRRYFVVRVGNQVVAAARIVWDRRDCRARVLDLKSLWDGLQGVLFAGLVQDLRREARRENLLIVVDVHTRNPRLHATLEALEFFPTAYYPSLIAIGSERCDAVQYTCLYHCGGFRRSFDSLASVQWPQARQVITCVRDLVMNHTRQCHGARVGKHLELGK